MTVIPHVQLHVLPHIIPNRTSQTLGSGFFNRNGDFALAEFWSDAGWTRGIIANGQIDVETVGYLGAAQVITGLTMAFSKAIERT